MFPLSDPSDLLTHLVAQLRGWMASADDLSERWERGWNLVTNAGVIEAWTMSAAEVMARGPIEKANVAELELLTDAGLACALLAIQILDEWHAPVGNDLSGEQLVHNADQQRCQVRLAHDFRFNTNADAGSLIPKYARSWRKMDDQRIRAQIERELEELDDDTGGPPSLRSILVNTAHLPPTILASADGNEGAPHDVSVLFRNGFSTGRIGTSSSLLRVAVAPILESEGDVTLSHTEDGTGYLVAPRLLKERLERAVQGAIEGDARILLLPEMVIDEEGLGLLGDLIQSAVGAFAEEQGRMPALAWTFAGVSVPGRDPPENYVAILDPVGSVLVRQHKFSRWNLRADEQRRFALLADDQDGPERLSEAIEPAKEAIVLDLPGLGRVSVLICADIDVSEPGDWLYANGGLDMVYAPIMDRSRSPRRVADEEDQEQWVVKKALRAARLTRGSVVVTNSMALSELNNRTNEERKQDFPPIKQCHIGLMLDGMPADLQVQIVTMDLGDRDIVEVRDWENGWEAYYA